MERPKISTPLSFKRYIVSLANIYQYKQTMSKYSSQKPSYMSHHSTLLFVWFIGFTSASWKGLQVTIYFNEIINSFTIHDVMTSKHYLLVKVAFVQDYSTILLNFFISLQILDFSFVQVLYLGDLKYLERNKADITWLLTSNITDY